MIELPKITYITREDEQYTHAEQARHMYENGVEWVQIRMKAYPIEEVMEQASIAVFYANKYNGKLIVNDSVEIAKTIHAHGVHLGLQDTPIHEARKYLGEKYIIGGTANTLNEIIMQISRGADYVGVGPFRFTKTKENLAPIIGIEGYATICNQLNEQGHIVPLVAVGGIEMEDIPEIISTGMSGVAISGALLEEFKQNKL